MKPSQAKECMNCNQRYSSRSMRHLAVGFHIQPSLVVPRIGTMAMHSPTPHVPSPPPCASCCVFGAWTTPPPPPLVPSILPLIPWTWQCGWTPDLPSVVHFGTTGLAWTGRATSAPWPWRWRALRRKRGHRCTAESCVGLASKTKGEGEEKRTLEKDTRWKEPRPPSCGSWP